MINLVRRSLAKCICKPPAGILTDLDFFEMDQETGVHITPVHFYDPVPDTRDLANDDLWDRPSELPGIDLRLEAQVELHRECGRKWIPEYNELLAQSPSWASSFSGVDGALLYSMVRKHEPNLIIEIGSGGLTLLSVESLHKNGKGRIIAIDPNPRIVISDGIDGTGGSMHVHFPEELQKLFPDYDLDRPPQSGSFWMVRID